MILDFLKKKKKRSLPEHTEEELKNIVNILFVDDIKFNLIKDIQEKDGWRNVSAIKDVSSLSQKEIKEAHIIFVDIQGVGKSMIFEDGGLGLIVAIKEKYPEKKVIMYSAENQGKIDAFHKAANIVDDRLRKSADRYEFVSKIERFSREIFTLDYCVKHLIKILHEEAGIELDEDDIKNKLVDLYNQADCSEQAIVKLLNVQNVGSVASIIQLIMMVFA